MWKVPLYKSDFGELEKGALLEAFEKRWFSTGETTQRFETEFAEYIGGGVEAVAVTNCTAALHIALLTLGVGPGDEVAIAATTFVADLNVVRLVGAEPVVVDATSLTDWNMSPDDLAKKMSPKTKAVIGVHFGGHPISKEIFEIAEKGGAVCIEDAAHAVGAKQAGKMCGSIGPMAAFSFYANKNLAIGEGGMFTTKDPEIARRARLLRTHGMTSAAQNRFGGLGVSYDIEEAGLNYRLDDLRASLGVVQLKRLDENNQKREKLTQRYHQLLGPSQVAIPFREARAGDVSAYHIYPVLLPDAAMRPDVMEQMKGAGIQTAIHYPAFRSFSFYRDKIKQETPVSDEISSRVITLPLYPAMSLEDVDFVASELRRALGE